MRTSIFDGFDNELNPENPEHNMIIKQRAIRAEWEEKISSYRTKICKRPKGEFAIETRYVLGLAEIHILQLTDKIHCLTDKLAYEVREALVDVFATEGLFFDSKFASGIADPDQPNDEERIAMMGVLAFASYAYDMNVSLLLDVKEHRKAFNLFFRLLLAHTEVEDVNELLQWHFEYSFGMNKVEYRLYLNALLRQASEDELITIKPGILETIEDWVDAKLKVNEFVQMKEAPSATNQEFELVESKQLSQFVTTSIYGQFLDALSLEIYKVTKRQVFTPDQLTLLKRHGFALPSSSSSQIYLKLAHNEKGIVYQCFFQIYNFLKENDEPFTKVEMANFLRSWFSDFHGKEDETMLRSLKQSEFGRLRIAPILTSRD